MNHPSTSAADLEILLRSDFASFIALAFGIVNPGQHYQYSWHHAALAHQLQEVAAGRLKRLLIAMPPRHLKSLICSVAFPAWLLGRHPTRRLICASYSAELSADHAAACRNLMKSADYQQLFPLTHIRRGQDSELDIGTVAGGRRLATSVGGTLTGRGGDIMIVDDPLKGHDAWSESARAKANDWFDNTLYPRLDSKQDGAIIVVMQRLHAEDLIGHCLEKGGYELLSLPAIAETESRHAISPSRQHHRTIGVVLHPEREPRPVLEQIRRDMGGLAFEAQYQQRPLPPEGRLIRLGWFKTFEPPLMRQPGDKIIQSWDTAVKTGENNDWSVCTTWLVRQSMCHLIDVFRDRLEFPDLKRAVLAEAQKHDAQTILIEESHGGVALDQELRSSSRLRPVVIRPDGDKLSRLYAQTAFIEAGHVLLPTIAPWRSDFLAEIGAFDKGRHDDQVDSLSQFLGWHRKQSRIVPRIIVL